MEKNILKIAVGGQHVPNNTITELSLIFIRHNEFWHSYSTGWLVSLFNGISTFGGYLMPKPSF